MDLLARREHSRYELASKLRLRFAESGDELAEALPAVLDRLEQDGLLSDERFVESYVRVRRDRGYGPVHIRQNLQQRRVAHSLIDAWVDDSDPGWQSVLRAVVHKKAGELIPRVGSPEYASLQRFLYARGFTAEQIRQVLRYE